MKKKMWKKLVFGVVTVMLLYAFSGLAFAEELTHQVTSKAQINKVSMYLKNVRKKSEKKLIVFEVVLKNISATPQKYEVVVLVPGIGGGQGAVPEGEAKIEPGELETAKVAVLHDEFPTSFQLIVKTAK